MKYLLGILIGFANSFTSNRAIAGEYDAANFTDLRQNIVMSGNLATSNSQTKKFTAFLEMVDKDNTVENICTGILIRKDIILTAGHCFSKKTVNVRVRFGVGGPGGFTTPINCHTFRWHKPNLAETSPWVQRNGSYVIPFDRDSRNRYEADMQSRTNWVNFDGSEDVTFDSFNDHAVIRIQNVPQGYEPISFYAGKFSFRMLVYGVGYGMYSRRSEDFTWQPRLRWSQFELVGHYTRESDTTIGYQIYSPTRQQTCYGDSGGPLVVSTNKGFQLIGINLLTYNNCANSNWYLNINYYWDSINEDITWVRNASFI